jgi:hypothetical protein
MKKSELSRYLDRLESGKTLEIRKNGIDDFEIVREIENIFDNKNLSQFQIRSTSFVSISTEGFKSYSDFGKKVKIEKNYDIDVICGVFETLLSIQTPILGKSTNINGKYETKKVGEYTGFYAYNKLRYILYNDKRYDVPDETGKLKKETFKSLNEVK